MKSYKLTVSADAQFSSNFITFNSLYQVSNRAGRLWWCLYISCHPARPPSLAWLDSTSGRVTYRQQLMMVSAVTESLLGFSQQPLFSGAKEFVFHLYIVRC